MKKDLKSLSIGFCYDDSLDSADGVSQYVKTLGEWLKRQGHEVVYLVGQTSSQEWAGSHVHSLSRNLTVNFNGNRLSTPLPTVRNNIDKVMAHHNLDVIHVQMPYSPFMAGKIIRRAGSQTALVGTFHIYPSGRLPIIGSRILNIFLRRELPKFTSVLSVSLAAASFAGNIFGIKSRVLPNVINLTKYQEATGLPKKNHIVFLGRLVKRKGCIELLRAFKILKQSMPDATLTIAGSGPQMRKLETYVKRNNLSSSVRFTGFIDEDRKPDLLASGAIACFPSLGGESFGIVLLEAMAAGSGVVIAGNNPGYVSVLGEYSPALFNPRDAAAFAGKLKLFLSDKKIIKKVHTAQVSRVQQFDVENVGPTLVSVYKAAIAKRSKLSDNSQ